MMLRFTGSTLLTSHSAQGASLNQCVPNLVRYVGFDYLTLVLERSRCTSCDVVSFQEDEYFIKGELPCCWECYKCRENEVVRPDDQGCQTCPQYTWPRGNSSDCEAIPLSYMHWADSLALGLCTLATIGLAGTIALSAIFIKHRNKKV